MTPILRDTTPADLPFVLAAERSKHARDFVTEWTARQHEHAIVDPDQWHLLLEDADEPIGFVLVAGLASEGAVELRRIVITRPGRGYGRTALELVLSRAFEHTEHVWLDVRPENTIARRLYSSLGFLGGESGAPTGAVGVSQPESLVIMSASREEWDRRRSPRGDS